MMQWVKNPTAGVPMVVQWNPQHLRVAKKKKKEKQKNPTTAARVTVEVWVQFPAQHSGLKDPALPKLQLGVHMSHMWP